jgi:hypothetical protein
MADEPVPASDTDFRGDGFALTARLTVREVLFGSPDGELELQGQTSRPPAQRVGPDEDRFPPDDLRRVPYWDQADDRPADVACLLGPSPTLRALHGADDDLPQAVVTIRTWLDGDADAEAIQQSLSSGDTSSPVGYVAGFELATRTCTDLAGLLGQFLELPGCPAAAVAGILEWIHRNTDQQPDEAVAGLAHLVLGVLTDRAEPEAMIAGLSWFDAHRIRLAQASPELLAAARARAADLADADSTSEAWTSEVRRFASALAET